MRCQTEVREESLTDHAAISAIHVAAFGGTAEADLVARLRADGDLLVSLVAVDGDAIVGHVLFSPLPIEIGDRVVPAVALAPLAVMRGRQRQGIGSALVRRGLALCRERGAAAVVVLGDPGYYQRCGFSVAAAAGLVTPWSGPHLMALELSPGALGAGRGTARYAPAFPALPCRPSPHPLARRAGEGLFWCKGMPVSGACARRVVPSRSEASRHPRWSRPTPRSLRRRDDTISRRGQDTT